ncbi:MAG: ubiquinone/menaquinone biosynthesis methyltransferase [Phycisphaerae bacterium]|nr:ubiquinone/menaquinone biosynthesis methyltransferase [Phycisphaerae bacterium]
MGCNDFCAVSNPMTNENAQFVFDAIAADYDRFNRLFSFGIDRWWRRKLVEMVRPHPHQQILDLCCGTGEVVFSFLRHSLVRTVAGADISEAMIDFAIEKQIQYSTKPWMQNKSLAWHVCDAAQTGLAAGSFDIITCAFGLRNISDCSAVLNEMRRLLKPKGKLGILEFALPSHPLAGKVYDFYLNRLMPHLAKPVLGASDPVRYLADSIRRWHNTVDFAGQLDKAGFKLICKTPLTAGIAALWLAHSQ